MISICNDFIKAEDAQNLSRLIGQAKPTELNHAANNHKYVTPSKILDENINPEIFALVNPYIGLIHEEINTVFSIDVHKEPNHSITVYSEGEYLNPHFDGMTDDYFKDKTPNGYDSRDMSSVLYLNDDYLGGVLRFPFLNLSIKPPAGCLIIFPSSEKYTHLVEKVEKGFRYIVPQFWCIK
jgi:predicted 2-oxoglutarate/Fe(II)-dependent dioxygenase YbiX